MNKKLRTEQKYFLQKSSAEILKMSLLGIMEKDPHLGEKRTYLIRSVYFDDPDDSCLCDKIDGVGEREKWRIRIYDADDSMIRLECKGKVGNMTYKDSARITRSQAESAINGDVGLCSGPDPVWNRFVLKMTTRGLRAVTIVQYERIPYIWRPSNVRITFDENIASSEMFDRFFDRDLPVRPIMPADKEIMEVKYDTLLPDHIRHSLSFGKMINTAFSKYALCRMMPMSFV